MARWLKQSTSVDLPIGPFLDSTDGVTAETGLTLTQPDVRLKKNGGAWAQKAAAQTLSHEENGWYEVTLDATDTDTLGQLMLNVSESGALPVWHEFMVVPANVWDSFFGADALQVHANEITAGLITAAAIATGAIDADAIADNAIDAGAIASGAITSAKFGAGAIDATAIASGAIDAATFAAGAIDAAALAADAGTEIAVAVWASAARTLTALDEDATTLDLDATIRAAVGLAAANLDTQLTAIDDAVDTEVAAILAAVDTEVAAIKAKTDNLPSDPADASDIVAAFALVDTDLTNIEADTQDIQARLPAALVGGRMDASVGAMGANTLTASALAADAGAEIADAVLDRDMATGADSGSTTVRTVRQALRFLRNRWAVVTGTLTVYKEDDTTASWTAAMTADAAADPITGSDPAGP